MNLEVWILMRGILRSSVSLQHHVNEWVYWFDKHSCVDVPCSNRLPILSISVGYVYCRPNLLLMILGLDNQEYWVSSLRQALMSWIDWNIFYSPPRGRFSHLAMFRLGSLLFIPAYLTVVMYRVFANSTEDGNFFLMAGATHSQHSATM